jgi:hypothetical protein
MDPSGFSDSSYFDGFYEWDPVKIAYVVCQVAVVATCPWMLYSIVWYERHSDDLRCRTLINQVACIYLETVLRIFLLKIFVVSFETNFNP